MRLLFGGLRRKLRPRLFMLGTELCEEDQKQVLDAFIYRMTHESVRRFPEATKVMYEGGYRLPLISDLEWLECTKFRVTGAKRLHKLAKYCLTMGREVRT